MGSLDWILYLEIAAFIVWEAYAHYILHNRQGHTLSNRILWVETHDRTRWIARTITVLALIVLGVHLQGVF